MKYTFQVDGEGSESRYLELSIGWIVQVVIYTPEYKLAGQIVTYASVACVGCIAGWALVELGAVAGAGLGTITTIYSGLDAILKLLERASIILRN